MVRLIITFSIGNSEKIVSSAHFRNLFLLYIQGNILISCLLVTFFLAVKKPLQVSKTQYLLVLHGGRITKFKLTL